MATKPWEPEVGDGRLGAAGPWAGPRAPGSEGPRRWGGGAGMENRRAWPGPRPLHLVQRHLLPPQQALRVITRRDWSGGAPGAGQHRMPGQDETFPAAPGQL